MLDDGWWMMDDCIIELIISDCGIKRSSGTSTSFIIIEVTHKMSQGDIGKIICGGSEEIFD